jgi:hypothetical protein
MEGHREEHGFALIVMAGAGRPSTSSDGQAKKDVDGGAKPRHDVKNATVSFSLLEMTTGRRR